VEAFWFIRDVDAPASTRAEAPADIAAAQLIGQLHDALAPSISGHDLEGFLTRIVFYLFADDTGIFDARHLLWDYLETRTADDGHDLGGKLAHLFQVLDTDAPDRSANLDADLAAFPYVNGALFASTILGARAAHPGATLADLYDPDLMPPDLRRPTCAARTPRSTGRWTGFTTPGVFRMTANGSNICSSATRRWSNPFWPPNRAANPAARRMRASDRRMYGLCITCAWVVHTPRRLAPRPLAAYMNP